MVYGKKKGWKISKDGEESIYFFCQLKKKIKEIRDARKKSCSVKS